MNPPQSLALEAQQAIDFLTKISESLKHQRRHFDDAVVTHCIRLANDYVEENSHELSTERPQGSANTGRRS